MTLSEATDAFVQSIDIHGVLPQQEPFVMIGVLTHFEMSTSTTETTIAASNIFVDDGLFSAYGMMENIAQTCAARVGYYNKYVLHKDVQTGFIGAIRDYRILSLPPVGSTIATRVDILEEVFGMTLARAEVTYQQHDETVVAATADIKLAVREEPQEIQKS